MSTPPDFDVLALTGELLSLDTAAGREDAAADVVQAYLEAAGLLVDRVPLEPGRSGVIGRFNGGGKFLLSGHLDTVALWSGGDHEPLRPEMIGGRFFGRGSSDMKAGVAAMCVAARKFAAEHPDGRGFTVLMSADEETGCRGAALPAMGAAVPAGSILVIGEATGNRVRFGHKGATWYRAEAAGIAAHGSRPDLGRNAIDLLARFLAAIAPALPELRHPALGSPTSNVGTFTGGTQTNMVPVVAECTIDIRTIPGMQLAGFEADLRSQLNDGALERTLHLEPVWSDPDSPVARALVSVVQEVTGEVSDPVGTSYFTDAAMLGQDAAGVFILGPGDPLQPHSVDESCEVVKIHEAVNIYSALLASWNQGELMV